MGRPSNIEVRRAQLADALVGLLATGSFETITTGALARAAGLAPGLVHHYFAAKEDVLVAAVARLALQLEQRLELHLRKAKVDPHARVDAFIDAWLAVDPGADPRAAFAWVAIGDEARRRPSVRELYAASFARAVERLSVEVAAALPALHRRRAPERARAIMIAIEGALRTGAAGALRPGTAAPTVRKIAEALLSAA